MPSFAPCVICKAKIALGLPNSYRGNRKRFSQDYWERVVKDVGRSHGRSAEEIRKAIRRYLYFLNLP